MDPSLLQNAAEDAKTYSAAHSMDSGWFAVDEDGNVAHFDTGEGGAIPAAAKLVTGEAAATGIDGWEFVLPWLARQRGASTEGLDLTAPFSAVFETEATAHAAAAEHGTPLRESKTRTAEFCPDASRGTEGSLHAKVSAMAGFIGFAPTYEDVFEDDAISERYPVFLYAHGTWEIPGEYVRRGSAFAETSCNALAAEELQDAERMATRFSSEETIQLADFYENAECDSWSQGDLRTGELPEGHRGRRQRDPASPIKLLLIVLALVLFVWFVFWLRS